MDDRLTLLWLEYIST